MTKEKNNVYIQYFKELIINWRCIQKKPIGGTLLLIKEDLEEDFINTINNYLSNFKINKNEFYWIGIIIKLI